MSLDIFHEEENPDDLPQVLLLPRTELLWQNKPLEIDNDIFEFLLKEKHEGLVKEKIN